MTHKIDIKHPERYMLRNGTKIKSFMDYSYQNAPFSIGYYDENNKIGITTEDGFEIISKEESNGDIILRPEFDRLETIKQFSYNIKDSTERQTFDSGMMRDVQNNKPRFDLLVPEGIPFEELYLTRIANHYSYGAKKYAERNWEQANSEEELKRAKSAAYRHFMQWFSGETDEDHASAVFFNINMVETLKYKLRKDKS